MPKRLIITTVCFHISAVLLLILGLGAIVFGLVARSVIGHTGHVSGDDLGGMQQVMSLMIGIMPVIIGIMSFLAIVGVELVIRGLNHLKYWAWIVGLVLCGLMIVSGFHNFIGLVIGGLALWGLVDPDTVAAFKPQLIAEPSSNSINTDDRIE